MQMLFFKILHAQMLAEGHQPMQIWPPPNQGEHHM
jgi:hypothetical protein